MPIKEIIAELGEGGIQIKLDKKCYQKLSQKSKEKWDKFCGMKKILWNLRKLI